MVHVYVGRWHVTINVVSRRNPVAVVCSWASSHHVDPRGHDGTGREDVIPRRRQQSVLQESRNSGVSASTNIFCRAFAAADWLSQGRAAFRGSVGLSSTMHLSSAKWRKQQQQKRKVPKAWQVDMGLVSKEEFLESKKKREEEEEKEKAKEKEKEGALGAAAAAAAGGGLKGVTSFATSSASSSSASADGGGGGSKKSSWSKIKKHVREQQRLEAEQEQIEARKKEMLLRSFGQSEKQGGSQWFVDVEVTDLIPKSGNRIVRASGRFIFEIFDDLVPNVARVFVEMVEGLAAGQIVYECSNNEMGSRCVWNMLDQKLDEAAMAVRACVRGVFLVVPRFFLPIAGCCDTCS
jgi:hypothetical protein